MSSICDDDLSVKDLPVRRKLVNTNLISLKCLLFFFFGGIGCLFPFLPLHMVEIGLTVKEIRIVSIAAPLVAIIGPLIAGFLADRMAGCQDSTKKPSTGRYLRVMIAVCCVFSVLFYSLLLIVPSVVRVDIPEDRRPTVRFSCDRTEAVVFQERCKDTIGCHRWSDEDSVGSLLLENCRPICDPTRQMWRKSRPGDRDDVVADPSESSGELAVEPLATDDLQSSALEQKLRLDKTRRRYDLERDLPHICFATNGRDVCHVYTNSSGPLAANISLRQATNPEDSEDYCAYPISQFFSCRVPHDIGQICFVECQLAEPYTVRGSILAESQCRQVLGNPDLTFWMYLGIRSLADIFPTAAVALINAAIVIATRETSSGRGDVGRQLAFGSLGFAAFGPLTGYLTTLIPSNPSYYLPIGLHAVMILIAACIALSANGMPLSPPEWWWHTRSGMVAVPLSAIKRYGGEAAALVLVLVIMGIFWSVMDSYLPLHLRHLNGNELSIGIALTIGALPAIFFLWRSEHFVDYCGHSNLLIMAFVIYIVRFTSLSIVPDVWWALISEALELFTLGIMWVTTILYFRHLIPRQMTVTGQALPVVAHFCMGRAIGALIGACIGNVEDSDSIYWMRFIYQCMAIAAAAVATFYFVLYHGLLKPRCHAQTVHNGSRRPPTIVQAMNGNYTPLRVYHNCMGKKGQFRY